MSSVPDFISLKKNLKKDYTGYPVYKLALIGDSSTQLLNQAIKGFGYEHGLNFDIYEADYAQINQEVFTSSSGLYQFQPQFILLIESPQKLLYNFQLSNDKSLFAQNHINHVNEFISVIKNYSKATIIYCNFSEIQDGVFGNYSNKVESSFVYQIRKINYELMNLCIQEKSLFINDISSLNTIVGLKNSFDPKLYITGDFVFSLDFTVLVAKNTIDIILPIIGKVKKCLILDLDNTLWGGIIGDDGIENIQIGDLGIGKAFTLLQTWAKQLKERGVILAVCSKNTESVAKEPFEQHPDMVLKLEDISIFVANWNNKADNIRYIQSILNIGFDSMVFLDDNPFERELVKKELPEVVVPELPNDPAQYLSYLVSLNLFETASFSQEDVERTKQYQDEAKRAVFKQSFTSEEDYLASLEMEAEVKVFEKFNIPRVAQLTQRSNQFNLRTIRYSEAEIAKFATDDKYKTLAISLKDKYGDHGLIAALILKYAKNALFIDTWVMSCRVLNRGVEQFILNQIIALAERHGVSSLIGEYIPTPKNMLVSDLFKNLGFRLNGNMWELDVSLSRPFKTYINAKK